MSRHEIPLELIPTAYEISKQVYDGKLTFQDGADKLSKAGMIKNSAKIYIQVFQELMLGKMTFSLNAPSILFCIQQIYKDFGAARCSKALTALKQYIDKGEKNGNSDHITLRIVYDEIFKRLSPTK